MFRFLSIACVVFALYAPTCLAQDDLGAQDEVPLGDLARQVRGAKPPEQDQVIDNDNIEHIMDKAESERLDAQPVFAISRSGVFTAVSPDGSCSLSFDARSANRTPAAYISTDLPQNELTKLEGPAEIQGGQLAVSLHNGTLWDLREVVVGISVLPEQAGPAEYRFATLESAPVVSMERTSDATTLYHLKGTGAPDSTTVFRIAVEPGFAELLAQKNWHWAIVGARGIPPAGPSASPAPSVASAGTSKANVESGATSIRESAVAGPVENETSSTSVSSSEVASSGPKQPK